MPSLSAVRHGMGMPCLRAAKSGERRRSVLLEADLELDRLRQLGRKNLRGLARVMV
jgi:hypothetical protein